MLKLVLQVSSKRCHTAQESCRKCGEAGVENPRDWQLFPNAFHNNS